MNFSCFSIFLYVKIEGVHADLAQTFLVGNVDENARKLDLVTKQCLHKAISITGPNVEFNKIGEVIE